MHGAGHLALQQLRHSFSARHIASSASASRRRRTNCRRQRQGRLHVPTVGEIAQDHCCCKGVAAACKRGGDGDAGMHHWLISGNVGASLQQLAAGPYTCSGLAGASCHARMDVYTHPAAGAHQLCPTRQRQWPPGGTPAARPGWRAARPRRPSGNRGHGITILDDSSSRSEQQEEEQQQLALPDAATATTLASPAAATTHPHSFYLSSTLLLTLMVHRCVRMPGRGSTCPVCASCGLPNPPTDTLPLLFSP